MKYYTVYDSNKPADKTGFPLADSGSYETATFNCRLKAIKYAKLWLGSFYVGYLPDNWAGELVNYSTLDHTIEIRETE